MPSDCFSEEPDFTPYTPKPVDARLFDPAKALKPFDRGFDWSRLLDSPVMDDPEDMRSGFEQEDRRPEDPGERDVRARIARPSSSQFDFKCRDRRSGDPPCTAGR